MTDNFNCIVALGAFRRCIPATGIFAGGTGGLTHHPPVAVAEAVGLHVAAGAAGIMGGEFGTGVLAFLCAVGPFVDVDHFRLVFGESVADRLGRDVVGLAVGVVAVAEEIAVAGGYGRRKSGEEEADGGGDVQEPHGEVVVRHVDWMDISWSL